MYVKPEVNNDTRTEKLASIQKHLTDPPTTPVDHKLLTEDGDNRLSHLGKGYEHTRKQKQMRSYELCGTYIAPIQNKRW